MSGVCFDSGVYSGPSLETALSTSFLGPLPSWNLSRFKQNLATIGIDLARASVIVSLASGGLTVNPPMPKGELL
jgi:hypothetical protein